MSVNDKQKLTYKQDLFCREFIIDNNAYQAAIRAGYSESTAKVKACDWLEKVSIKERIQALRQKITDKLDVSAEKVVAELAKLGFANIKDFVDINEEGETTFKSFEGIDNAKLAAIKSIKVSKTENKDGNREYTTTNFELYNKESALEKLGRYLGIFKDNAPNQEKEAAIVARMSDEDKELARLLTRIRTEEEARKGIKLSKGA